MNKLMSLLSATIVGCAVYGLGYMKGVVVTGNAMLKANEKEKMNNSEETKSSEEEPA